MSYYVRGVGKILGDGRRGLLVWVWKDIKASEYIKGIYKNFIQSCILIIPMPDGSHVPMILVYRPHRVYENDVTNTEK